MTGQVEVSPGRHVCHPPDVDWCPPDIESYVARWRCPDCRQRWSATVWHRPMITLTITKAARWGRDGSSSWRWERARRRTLQHAITNWTPPERTPRKATP